MQLLASAFTIGSSAPLDWWVACGAAISCVVIACHVAFGGLIGTIFTDFFLAAVSEGLVMLALNSPLDVLHLHGQPLVQWSLALGTGFAILGVLLNHLAQTPAQPR